MYERAERCGLDADMTDFFVRTLLVLDGLFVSWETEKLQKELENARQQRDAERGR